MAWVACTVSVSAWSQLSIHSAWRLDIAWGTCTVPVYDFSWVSRQYDVGIWCEGHVLYLYMILGQSPCIMMLGYVTRGMYCTCIWSQLCLQATWRLDMVWWECTVLLYDLSWVPRQHGVEILCEGPVLYLYMISAESPSSMAFGYCMRGLHFTCIWSQLSLQATWCWDLVQELQWRRRSSQGSQEAHSTTRSSAAGHSAGYCRKITYENDLSHPSIRIHFMKV